MLPVPISWLVVAVTPFASCPVSIPWNHGSRWWTSGWDCGGGRIQFLTSDVYWHTHPHDFPSQNTKGNYQLYSTSIITFSVWNVCGSKWIDLVSRGKINSTRWEAIMWSASRSKIINYMPCIWPIKGASLLSYFYFRADLNGISKLCKSPSSEWKVNRSGHFSAAAAAAAIISEKLPIASF